MNAISHPLTSHSVRLTIARANHLFRSTICLCLWLRHGRHFPPQNILLCMLTFRLLYMRLLTTSYSQLNDKYYAVNTKCTVLTEAFKKKKTLFTVKSFRGKRDKTIRGSDDIIFQFFFFEVLLIFNYHTIHNPSGSAVTRIINLRETFKN